MRTEYSPGVFSAWSASQTFEFFSTPINPIVAGLDAGIDATPTLQWTPQIDAVSYDIRVMNEQGQVTYLAERVPGISHRVATAQQLGNYNVSMRANYSDGSRSDWGFGQTLFITGRPEVTIDNSRVFWTNVKAATSYELWVDRIDHQGNRLQRQVVYANDIKALSYQLPNLSSGRYAVWVRAIRAEGGETYTSFWSTRVEFQVGTTVSFPQFVEGVASGLKLTSLSQRDAGPVSNDRIATVNKGTAEPANAQLVDEQGMQAVNAVMEELAGVGLPGDHDAT
jgi:hypothetical protein